MNNGKEIETTTVMNDCPCGKRVMIYNIRRDGVQVARGALCSCGTLFIRDNPEIVRKTYGR